MHSPISWYETPLSQLSGGEARRHQRQSFAEDGFEESTRPRIDPYVSGLAWALLAGAGRAPFIP